MRRVMGVACSAVAWWLVSCRDVQAPPGGVLSVSPIILPSPGVVFQDTMRDSTGVVAPLSFVAFGLNNDTVNAEKTFFVLDTGAHFGGPFLVADSFNITVEVVGSVDAIQTKRAPVMLTLSPDTLVAADSVLQHITYSLTRGDTVADAPLATLVQHRPADGVAAVIVKYLIERAPAGALNAGPAVVLVDGNVVSERDTTDISGKASRAARLRIGALTTFTTDTAVVSATASYRGHSIGRVVFTVIFTNQ